MQCVILVFLVAGQGSAQCVVALQLSGGLAGYKASEVSNMYDIYVFRYFRCSDIWIEWHL